MTFLSRAIAAVLITLSALSAEALTIRVDAQSVTISDVSPGSNIVLFAIGREPRGNYSAVRRWVEVLADEDRDGVIRFASTITNKSIWIAIDLETGDHAAQTGPDYPRRELAAGTVFKRNNVGQLSKFDLARGLAEVLVVRAKKGAWFLSAAKNSSKDEAAGTPDALHIDASSLVSLRGVKSDELKHLKKDDVVAMIDPRRMEFFLIQVGED